MIDLWPNEVLRVTPEGKFIWAENADEMIETGDFSASPAMPHILRALRLNAELVEALRWIDMRCPAILLDHPLHRGLHMEAAYDAGACARAALAKVEASK